MTNLFGSRRRIDLAFGPKPLEFVKRAVDAAEALLPPKFGKLWQFRDLAQSAVKLGHEDREATPRFSTLKQSPVDLEKLPFLQLWHEDGGHFNTLPLVYTESPTTGKHNLGIYRMQRYDATTTGMHWQIGKGGGFHYFEAEQQKRSAAGDGLSRRPAGDDPGGDRAVARRRAGTDARVAAGGREDRNGRKSARRKVIIDLIAEAEFAICGHVAAAREAKGRPVRRSLRLLFARSTIIRSFSADAVFHRKDAIYPATVVGKPRQEDFFIGDYLQELLSPLFPLVMPAVRDLWSYGETGFHSLAAAVVRNDMPARRCRPVSGSWAKASYR